MTTPRTTARNRSVNCTESSSLIEINRTVHRWTSTGNGTYLDGCLDAATFFSLQTREHRLIASRTRHPLVQHRVQDGPFRRNRLAEHSDEFGVRCGLIAGDQEERMFSPPSGWLASPWPSTAVLRLD